MFLKKMFGSDRIEDVFIDILDELSHAYSSENLPHFFLEGFNLLDQMPKQVFHRITNRLLYLSNNRREVLRIIKKRKKEPSIAVFQESLSMLPFLK